MDEFELPTPREGSISEVEVVPFREEPPEPHQPVTTSTFSLLPSLRFPSAPRQLHTPLPFLGPEYLQISDVTSSELELKLCVFPFFGCNTQTPPKHRGLTHSISRLAALMRSRQFGIYLTGLKQDAILRGDLSNTVVHPFFVHAMTPLGMHFCAGLKHSPTSMQLRAKHAQRTFEHIAELVIGDDTNLLVQAFSFVAVMSLHARYFEATRHNLKKACIALNAAKLRFIPVTGRPPRLTEDLRERLVILSQVIYLENYMFLAVDGIEPNMTTRIANEFRAELQVRVRFLTPAAWADD